MVVMYSQLTQEVRVVFHIATDEHTAYQIIGAEGQTIRKGKLPPGIQSHNISTTGLPEGKYTFTAKDVSVPFEKRKLFN